MSLWKTHSWHLVTIVKEPTFSNSSQNIDVTVPMHRLTQNTSDLLCSLIEGNLLGPFFFALCSVAYVQFFLTFSNLLLSAWGRTFPLAGSQPLTFEARFQRPASCATAGIFEILRKSKISQNIFFLSSTSLTHVCLIYCAGCIYPTNYTSTVSQSHFS